MENTLIALVGLVAVTIYWGNSINSEHSMLRVLTKYLSAWMIYGAIGAIQRYTEIDASGTTLVDLMSAFMMAYGVFMIFLTLYLILMPLMGYLYSMATRKRVDDNSGQV